MIRRVKTANREEWLKQRMGFIGGSDASAVVGMNPYCSRYALWAEKTGRKEPFEGNITTDVGAYLEEFVADLFAKETGKKVRRDNYSIFNDLYPWGIAHIDRAIIGESAFLECKTTTSVPLMKKLRNSEEFPDAYLCQCTHYLAMTGYEKCYLAVLIANREFKIYELQRDENEIQALMQAEKEFWELVKSDTPPAPDGTDSSSATISELYPRSDDSVVDLLPVDGLLNEYMSLSAQIKMLTELRDEKANRVKAYMREAGHGESQLYKVSYTSAERRSLDTALLQKENPKLVLDNYYKTSNYRTFKVTQKDK